MAESWWSYPIDHRFETVKATWEGWFETAIKQPVPAGIEFGLVGNLKNEDQLAVLKQLRRRKGDIKEVEKAIATILDTSGTPYELHVIKEESGSLSTGIITSKRRYHVFTHASENRSR